MLLCKFLSHSFPRFGLYKKQEGQEIGGTIGLYTTFGTLFFILLNASFGSLHEWSDLKKSLKSSYALSAFFTLGNQFHVSCDYALNIAAFKASNQFGSQTDNFIEGEGFFVLRQHWRREFNEFF